MAFSAGPSEPRSSAALPCTIPVPTPSRNLLAYSTEVVCTTDVVLDPVVDMPMQGVVKASVGPAFSPNDEFYGAAPFAERALGLTRALSSEHLRGRFQVYRRYLDLQTSDLARFPDESCDELGLCSRTTELRLVSIFDMLRSPLVDPRKECCLICSGMHGFKI